jgi:hypothetical protein
MTVATNYRALTSLMNVDYVVGHEVANSILFQMWGIPHSATIGELLKAVFSLRSVPWKCFLWGPIPGYITGVFGCLVGKSRDSNLQPLCCKVTLTLTLTCQWGKERYLQSTESRLHLQRSNIGATTTVAATDSARESPHHCRGQRRIKLRG